MLGTNFRDYAIVFTQLELEDEAFSTVELYSECPRGARHPCSTCRGYKGICRLQPPPSPSESAASLCSSPLYEVASWGPHAFLSWLHPHRPALAPTEESRALHRGRDAAPDARAGGGGGPHGAKGLGIRGQSPCQPSLQSCRQASQPQGYQGHPCPPGRTERASQAGLSLFAKWSQGLGFLSQQQATLQTDCECPGAAQGHADAHGHAGPARTVWPCAAVSLGDPPGLRESGRTGGSSRSHSLPAQNQAWRVGPVTSEGAGRHWKGPRVLGGSVLCSPRGQVRSATPHSPSRPPCSHLCTEGLPGKLLLSVTWAHCAAAGA